MAEAPKSPTAAGPSDFSALTSTLNRQDGLFTIYSSTASGKSYLAIAPEQLNRNFLLMATLESGVGEAGLFRGRPINQFLMQFRPAPDGQIQIVVPNTYLQPPGSDTDARSRELRQQSFSDSTILAANVVSVDPVSQAQLIDLSQLLLKQDLADLNYSLSYSLSGYGLNEELSRLEQFQAFPENVELGAALTFSGTGKSSEPLTFLLGQPLRSLADRRGFSLQVRYSLSALPDNPTYRPRPADERVGYFPTVFRLPPVAGQTDGFERYINRWHLEKQNPDAELSPPVEPLVFWLENTVPEAYRADLQAGVLMWNEAFEQAGFENAIEVRQMPDDADWDPADVRYNVVRWIDTLRPSFMGFGPSRVNPLTGEILDADVILDANVVSWLQRQFQSSGLDLSPAIAAYLNQCGQATQDWTVQWAALQQGGEDGLAAVRQQFTRASPTQAEAPSHHHSHLCRDYQNDQQTAFAALAMSTLPNLEAAQLEGFIHQYLTALTAHEIGHGLGLRHNFAGSQLLSPAELNDPSVTRSRGLVSSVMDYFPPNIAPEGTAQGDFFPTKLGPYDRWAVEYGYRQAPVSLVTSQEQHMLRQILARSNDDPALVYATDEDILDYIDPEVGAWDLSNDPLQFADWQLDNAQAVWERLDRLSVSRGEGFGSLRRRVDLVFRYFAMNTSTLTNYIGGQRYRRLDPWTSRGVTPLAPISADKQRQALAILNEKVFAPDAFEFSPQLINQLPPDRWWHWGVAFNGFQLDYPIYERVLDIQSLALSDVMLSGRLARLRDTNFRTDETDIFTIAELFDGLYQGIWTELSAGTVPELTSLRRGLQRHHLNLLTNLVLRRSFEDALSAQSFPEFAAVLTTLGAPDDARVLARYQLQQMGDDIEAVLNRYGRDMAVTTQAHLEAILDRIDRVLDASVFGA